ncbi:hypothetical protein J4E93_008252 [Alternaria ventricosa]|uniref:uncharacterized protein n=1 Tax=Alternaria ventricosa TaxID=1187951 RepID=UPI0020C26824|nr:uncharacterized protein J4E93_008252 [Alternaria ventricosa]KAI4640662.1 hypothetical protein J4E93_008252 [Alternaria ventricosa]
MASGTKKRRKSQSPARGTTSKRARVASSGTSKRTQHDEPDSHSSRAGSVKDTYLSQKQGRSISLPTGDDWAFRVKVISSATDLGDDLFKNAVQGLVRICFPEGILDQLGSQILAQHMREEKAPEGNILRMEEVFQSEMTQRIASMVAEHLDTAAQIDLVLKVMLSRSARTHGEKLGQDILGHFTASLLKLKERASEYSTEWLARGDAAQEEDSSDGDMDTSHLSDREPTMPPKTKKKRDKESKRGRPSAGDPLPTATKPYVNALATPLARPNSRSKDRKISSKWPWDIDAALLAEDAVSRIFSRTSDLFAYHALPISRRKLGPSASKKEMRCEMQSLLDGMPTEEFRKWVESLQKLLNGDREMLKLPDTYSPDDEQRLSRATPAPIDTRRRSRKATKETSSRLTDPGDHATSTSKPSHKETHIKHEAITHPVDGLARPHEGNQTNLMSEATSAFERLSTEERQSQSHINSRETANEDDFRGSRNMTDLVSVCWLAYFNVPNLRSETPATLLLWGTGTITSSHCFEVTRTIMDNLSHRNSAEYIAITGLDGKNKTRTKAELEHAIVCSFPKPGPPFSFITTVRNIEAGLVPWVVAKPGAFPELKDMPFVFTYMMTVGQSKHLDDSYLTPLSLYQLLSI